MNETHVKTNLGIAGHLAQAFIRSKLTPLLILSSLLLGTFAVMKLPREEEPQINVPMFDIFVPFPGASSEEVEQRVVNLGERKIWEIPGVEYIYSTSQPGMAMFIVRFKVGTDPEEAMTRLYAKTSAHADLMPPGTMAPLIKPRSIDDVPVLVLTLWGPQDELALRRAAATLRQEISAVPGVSETQILGGRKRQLLVHFLPEKLSRHRLSPLEIAGILQASNQRLPAGHYNSDGKAVTVDTDAFIHSVDDLKRVVVGVSSGRPILLQDVAEITDGPDETEQDVKIWGAGAASSDAVTLAVSKRRGMNATKVVAEVLKRVEHTQRTLLPSDIKTEVTRNYGATAKEKSDELLFHMILATISVTILIGFALGIREALVVLIAIPVTLGLTLFLYFMAGYTLNRITLFALIFSIGILVDDAIVVVENIHRHYSMRDGRPLWKLAVDAVSEVGNPTFLATWAVIAAILPMAFVGGLMGPYMRPIPVGASGAMIFSLAVAFIVSPWAFIRLLEMWKPNKEHCEVPKEGKMDKLYRRGMRKLLDHAGLRHWYFAAMIAMLLGACSMVYFKLVTVKMLPFDNKNEFEVVLNMPEGTALAATQKVAGEMAEVIRAVPEVETVTAYSGLGAPYNFNGLVRHYFLRTQPNQAGIVVTLKDKSERKRQSHAIASSLRGPLHEIARKHGARMQVAEVPPGPPVLSTIVLEIYGPDPVKQLSLARRVKSLLEQTEGVTDVDTYVPDAQPLDRLMVDRERATLNGIPAAQIARTVSVALDGQTLDLAHIQAEKEPVEIRLRLPESKRRGLSETQSITLLSRNGTPIALKDLTTLKRLDLDAPIYHKNLMRAAYVIADVSGKQESPVYALLKLRKEIDKLAASEGVELKQYFARQPDSSLETAVKWDGEWQITYEVFRDLGLAFALVLVLIYILVVAWFESFTIPLVIMAPIPLTLVGILPAHWGLGAFFTATSMIGFIAGAGIVVRNSIILVDFIQLRMREGMPLKEAVIDAGAVRFRPMLLTAAAVVVGAGVILFDPIFQGLAVALMAGEVASTLLSRTAVPVLYYLLMRRQHPEVKA